jgi:hypothetical protein
MAEPQKTAVVQTTDAAQAANQKAADNLRDKQARDAAKAPQGEVTMIATSDFTMVTDEQPDGKVIRAGQEFSVSKADLPRFEGRGRPKSADAE